MGNVTVARDSKIIPYLKEYGRDRQVLMTIGWRFKNPTTKDVPMTTAEAIDYIEKNEKHYALVELDERHNMLFLNFYTANDMW